MQESADGFSEEERDAAIYTLDKTLSTVLKLLAPITPFIPEHLWQTLYSETSIHTEGQEAESTEDYSKTTEEVRL